MATDNSIPPGIPAWEHRVLVEVKAFMEATRSNFTRGLNGTLSFIPKAADGELDKGAVATQLNRFNGGAVQIAIECIASYAGLSTDVEVQTLKAVQDCFATLREMKEESIAKAKAVEDGKAKVLGPNGQPAGERMKLVSPQGTEL